MLVSDVRYCYFGISNRYNDVLIQTHKHAQSSDQVGIQDVLYIHSHKHIQDNNK